ASLGSRSVIPALPLQRPWSSCELWSFPPSTAHPSPVCHSRQPSQLLAGRDIFPSPLTAFRRRWRRFYFIAVCRHHHWLSFHPPEAVSLTSLLAHLHLAAALTSSPAFVVS
ncbi:hypothetical protein CORC01_01862, partial [Colletotrichum orchidophilum]